MSKIKPNLMQTLEGRKKGVTKFYLNDDEEQKYLLYTPVMDEILNWQELKRSKMFAIKTFKDSVYRGEIENSMRHGLGVITYSSSRVYEGHWVNDKREGLGYERFSNGNTYHGEYSKGKVCGQGKYTWSSGEFYDGLWKDGHKEGYGVWQGTEGDQYIGQW